MGRRQPNSPTRRRTTRLDTLWENRSPRRTPRRPTSHAPYRPGGPVPVHAVRGSDTGNRDPHHECCGRPGSCSRHRHSRCHGRRRSGRHPVPGRRCCGAPPKTRAGHCHRNGISGSRPAETAGGLLRDASRRCRCHPSRGTTTHRTRRPHRWHSEAANCSSRAPVPALATGRAADRRRHPRRYREARSATARASRKRCRRTTPVPGSN